MKIYRCGSDNPPLFPLIAWKTRKVQTKNAVVRKHQVRLVTSCIWGYLCSTDQGRTMSRIKDVSINIRFICCNRWKYASSQYVVKYWFMSFYHVGSCCFFIRGTNKGNSMCFHDMYCFYSFWTLPINSGIFRIKAFSYVTCCYLCLPVR